MYFAPSSTTDTASEIRPARSRTLASSAIETGGSIPGMIPPRVALSRPCGSGCALIRVSRRRRERKHLAGVQKVVGSRDIN